MTFFSGVFFVMPSTNVVNRFYKIKLFVAEMAILKKIVEGTQKNLVPTYAHEIPRF